MLPCTESISSKNQHNLMKSSPFNNCYLVIPTDDTHSIGPTTISKPVIDFTHTLPAACNKAVTTLESVLMGSEKPCVKRAHLTESHSWHTAGILFSIVKIAFFFFNLLWFTGLTLFFLCYFILP